MDNFNLAGFCRDIDTLRSRGLSRELAEQLRAAGNPGLVDELLAWPDDNLEALSRAYAQMDAAARGVGEFAARTTYRPKETP